jgi:hypothetical protein
LYELHLTPLLGAFHITRNIYKVFETPTSQIYNFAIQQGAPTPKPNEIDLVQVDVECANCKTVTKVQANLKPGIPMQDGAIPFPKDDMFVCPSCQSNINIADLRKQIESQTKKRIL